MSNFGIRVESAGGPEVLQGSELDAGNPGIGEVLISQKAIGVNFIDIYYRNGLYPWPTTPLILGSEAAGVVEALGENINDFKVGDRVAYVLPLGAYRSTRVVAAERLVKIPESVSFEIAASSMLKGMTAQFLLTSTYPIKQGDWVLVHAASGGVGLLMGQWLNALGAIAIGTVGSPEKIALARSNGYSHVIDYRSEDFVTRTREITGGWGVDVVYDSVGKDTWRGSLQCLRTRGMFVSFGQSSGLIPDFKLSDLAAGGSLFASRPVLFDYIKSPIELKNRSSDLFARLATGEVKAHVGQKFALRDAALAHKQLESRKTVGATVLLP